MKRRRTPMAALLARIGWRRDPVSWRVLCRDQRGRRVGLWIELGTDGIVLRPDRPGPLTLSALTVGRLRNALHDAAYVYGTARAAEEVDHDQFAA